MRILAICPTRDRPECALGLAKSFQETSGFAELMFYTDDDQGDAYRFCMSLDKRVKMYSGPRIGPIKSVNSVIEKHPADVYGMVPDDCYFKTSGWDQYIAEQVSGFPNGVGVVAPHTNFGEQVDMPFATREWIDAAGWFGAPNLVHYCWPTVIATLGYCADPRTIIHADPKRFYIHHDVRFSQGYGMMLHDSRQFYDFMAQDFPAAVKRMRTALETT